MYQGAVRGAVTDDPQGFATMFPSDVPDLLDISSTPNRLLQGNLTGQASAHGESCFECVCVCGGGAGHMCGHGILCQATALALILLLVARVRVDVVQTNTQAVLSPGHLLVSGTSDGPLTINISLAQQPNSAVRVAVSVPHAWDGSPMAEVVPLSLLFEPGDDGWARPQAVTLQPRPVCDGDYFLTFDLQ